MATITRIKDYLEEILPNCDTNNNDNIYSTNRSNTQCYYRGESTIYGKTSFKPNIYRDDQERKESEFYHNIKVECANEFRHQTKLEQLVTMQHYSSPTRLLDITKNPLVALYFATQNEYDKDGIVYIVSPTQKEDAYKNILYSDSDKALMLASLAKFTQKEKDQLKETLICFKNKKKTINQDVVDKLKACATHSCNTYKINSNCTYCCSSCSCKCKLGAPKNKECYQILLKYLHEIQTENPAFVPYIEPEDIFKKYIVQPEKTNNRIIKQDGAFIIWGLDKNNFDFAYLIFNDLSRYIELYDQNRPLNILLDYANDQIENLLTGINLDIETSINLNIKPRIKNCKSKDELQKLLKEIVIEIKEHILLIDGLKIKHLIIPADSKKDILKELDLLNINEASLFPEIDHVANYLKKHL